MPNVSNGVETYVRKIVTVLDRFGKKKIVEVTKCRANIENGVEVDVRELPPVNGLAPLASDVVDAAALDEALGATAVAYQLHVEELEESHRAKDAEIQAKDANAQTLLAENDALKSQLAAVQLTPSETQMLADLAAKDANIQALIAQVADLQAQLAALTPPAA